MEKKNLVATLALILLHAAVYAAEPAPVLTVGSQESATINTNSNYTDIRNNGTLTNNSVVDTVMINNAGTLTNAISAEITAMVVSNNSGTLDNQGSLTITGSLNNSAKFTSSGDLNVAHAINNSVMEITGGTFNSTSTFHNYGTLTNSGEMQASILNNLSGKLENNSKITVETINNKADFSNAGTLSTTTITNDKKFTNSGSITTQGIFNNKEFTSSEKIDTKFLTNRGTFTNSGEIDSTNVVLNEGTLKNTNKITTNNYVNQKTSRTENTQEIKSNNLSNFGLIDNKGKIENTGDLTNSGTLNNSGNLTTKDFLNDSTFNNKENGTFKTDSIYNSQNGTIRNDGEITTKELKNFSEIINNKNLKADSFVNEENSSLVNYGEVAFDSITNKGSFTSKGEDALISTKKIVNEGVFALENGAHISVDSIDNKDKTIILKNGSNLNITAQENGLEGLIGAIGLDNNLNVENNGTAASIISELLVGNGVDETVLTLVNGNILDETILNITKNGELKIENGNSAINFSSEDNWAGIIQNKGTVNAADFKSAPTAGLIQEEPGSFTNIQNSNIHLTDPRSSIKTGEINVENNSVLTLNSSIVNGDAVLNIDPTSVFNSSSGGFKNLGVLNLGSDGTNTSLFNAVNKGYETYNIKDMVIDNQADFKIDIYGRSNRWHNNDAFNAENFLAKGDKAVLNISDWVLNGDLYGWDAPIDRKIAIDHLFRGSKGENFEIISNDKTVFTPIGWYQLNPRGGGNYTLDMVKFNPQVFRGQVATVAQWMNQISIDDMLFTHSMVLPSFKDEDKMANRYSATDSLFAPYQYSRKDGGTWYKAYGNFGKLQMNQGFKVTNNSYGVLIGNDFGLKELKNGWKFMPTVYLGYNGAHQSYPNGKWPGVSMYQNGGQLGFLGTWYKNNFIFGALAYGGLYDNRMDMEIKSDNTFNYFAGAAFKTAYNIRLHRDLVLQPNLFAAYNYFGSQNWHSTYGQMGMTSDMLNGVNVAPGLNLIWEKETFSTYLTLQYMYNVNGATGGRAGNVGLPQVEMERGYIQYGIGFTKRFSDKCFGYAQAVLRNVGNTSVGFQMGLELLVDWDKMFNKFRRTK